MRRSRARKPMLTEKDKMLAGDLYDPLDPQLVVERRRARLLTKALNDTRDDQQEERARLIRTLIPASGRDNCVVLDVAPVSIGSRVLFAPAVQIYAATHPLSAEARAGGLELGKPVSIGDDVWMGGGAIVCPGVRIGERSVVAAGSVVTRDIPAGVLAAGNPCRVIREIR